MSNGEMRLIEHYGQPNAERINVVLCQAVPLTLTLQSGMSIGAGLEQAMREAGYQAGYFELRDVSLQSLSYVIPAPASDNVHAAWYSETRMIEDQPQILRAGLHFGENENAPMIHCHGIWRGQSTAEKMGHLLFNESIIRQTCVIKGWGIKGACLVSREEPETHFRLFHAEKKGEFMGEANAALCTLRPNQDITSTIANIARNLPFETNDAHGIGSLVGTKFEDGNALESYACEVLFNRHKDREDFRLESFAVGFDGQWARGALVRNQNAICVTAEVLLV